MTLVSGSLPADPVPSMRGDIGRALLALNYPEPYDRELLDSFGDRWDGYTIPKLLRAIREAPSVDDRGFARWPDEPEDRILAIFASGYSSAGNLPAVRDAIAPFLISAFFHERWAAALVLGWQQDERAIPALSTMLTEYLPPHLRYLGPKVPEMRVEYWRQQIPRMLTRPWRRAAFVPVLRGSLEQLLVLRQTDPDEVRDMLPALRDGIQREWQLCCETIVFALGRLGAYAALESLPLSGDQRMRWRVHLVMGALHDAFPRLHIATWAEHPNVRDACDTLLEREYGLAGDERSQALRRYEEWYLQYSYRHTPSPWVEGWE